MSWLYVVPAGIVGPVRMPEAVTIIPGGFFSECKNLKGVIFHDKITAIGDSAFAYCNRLETLTIGKKRDEHHGKRVYLRRQ